MKSMKNFAAQQLSKKEMNNVKGGSSCVAYDLNGGEIGSGSFPGSHVAEARVKMAIELHRAGFGEGEYVLNCR